MKCYHPQEIKQKLTFVQNWGQDSEVESDYSSWLAEEMCEAGENSCEPGNLASWRLCPDLAGRGLREDFLSQLTL